MQISKAMDFLFLCSKSGQNPIFKNCVCMFAHQLLLMIILSVPKEMNAYDLEMLPTALGHVSSTITKALKYVNNTPTANPYSSCS